MPTPAAPGGGHTRHDHQRGASHAWTGMNEPVVPVREQMGLGPFTAG